MEIFAVSIMAIRKNSYNSIIEHTAIVVEAASRESALDKANNYAKGYFSPDNWSVSIVVNKASQFTI